MNKKSEATPEQPTESETTPEQSNGPVMWVTETFGEGVTVRYDIDGEHEEYKCLHCGTTHPELKPTFDMCRACGVWTCCGSDSLCPDCYRAAEKEAEWVAKTGKSNWPERNGRPWD